MTETKKTQTAAPLSDAVDPNDVQPPLDAGGGPQENLASVDAEPTLPADLPPELGAYLEALVKRRVQSAQDKRIAQLEKQYQALLEKAVDAKPASTGENALLAFSSGLNEPISDVEETDVLDVSDGSFQNEVPLPLEPGQSDPDPTMSALLNVLTQLSARLAQSDKLAGQTTPTPAIPASLTSAGPSIAGYIQPTGGPPRPDLNTEYARRKASLRPGDLHGLMALKREYRAKGLDIF